MNIPYRKEPSSAVHLFKKEDLDVQHNYPNHIIGDFNCCCQPLEKYIWVELIQTENNSVK